MHLVCSILSQSSANQHLLFHDLTLTIFPAMSYLLSTSFSNQIPQIPLKRSGFDGLVVWSGRGVAHPAFLKDYSCSCIQESLLAIPRGYKVQGIKPRSAARRLMSYPPALGTCLVQAPKLMQGYCPNLV